MRALVIGSAVACSLGLLMGAHLKPGLHQDGIDLRGAADSLAQLAAPPAEAAEPDDGVTPLSPVLYVKSDGAWVPAVERQIADEQKASDAQSAQATALQQASYDEPIQPPIDAAAIQAQPKTRADPPAPAPQAELTPHL